ncbi:hypothetical protein [Thiopseudomonas alkaliphila]|uniref:hypothetical protein n=1 Tax=Thiopseudomonas alkaliphila TaxID=1697053 RepID=UPI0018F44594|nr:hypothetical protein [Thiopseudomonas alkaliphila]
MEIENEAQLEEAVEKASELLQAIQDYCGRDNIKKAKIRFPRGYIRTASVQRGRLRFIKDQSLKSNLAYTLMLSDVVLWNLIRTDISGTANQMLIKLFIFLGGSMVESITKDYLKGICGKNFKKRTEYLVDNQIIPDELKEELDWVWDTRNNMHLFMLDGSEYENSYNASAHTRCAKAFKGLIETLAKHGRISS